MSKLSKETIEKLRAANKPCLVKSIRGGYIKWEDKSIIFENPSQAGDFIRRHQEFKDEVEFGNAVQLVDKITLDFTYIEYKDLVKLESYKKETSIDDKK